MLGEAEVPVALQEDAPGGQGWEARGSVEMGRWKAGDRGMCIHGAEPG